MKRDEIDQLSDAISQVRVEFERFFNGALPIPPLEELDKIKSALRGLRVRPGSSVADRFRLTQLEARFNTYSELFNRRLRDREEGRARVAAQATQADRPDARSGIVLGRELAPEAVEALYSGLARGGGRVRFDLDSFRSYLDRQISSIRKKTGCEQVRFRLVDEGGQTKLKAMPLKTG